MINKYNRLKREINDGVRIRVGYEKMLDSLPNALKDLTTRTFLYGKRYNRSDVELIVIYTFIFLYDFKQSDVNKLFKVPRKKHAEAIEFIDKNNCDKEISHAVMLINRRFKTTLDNAERYIKKG